MHGSIVPKDIQLKYRNDGTIDVAWLRMFVREQCEHIKGHYFVNVGEIGRKVEIIRDGIDHGVVRRNINYNNGNNPNKPVVNAKATLNIVDTLKNSIEVNRKDGRNNDVEFVRVMLGVTGFQNDTGSIDYYAVRMLVEERKNRLPVLTATEVIGRLTAINAKKIDPANARAEKSFQPLHVSSLFSYSISDLLKEVNTKYVDTFSTDVYNHFGMSRRRNDFSSDLKFQQKSVESMTDEEVMAMELEDNSEVIGEILRSTADIELNENKLGRIVRKKLREYGISQDSITDIESYLSTLLESVKDESVKGKDFTADLTKALEKAINATDYGIDTFADERMGIVETLKSFTSDILTLDIIFI